MPSPLPIRLTLGAAIACAGALAASPAANATTLKLPAPAAGEVAVAAAPVTGTLKVAKAGVPKGVAVTGGVVSSGGQKLALIAVVRSKKAAKPAVKVTAAKIGTAATSGAVLVATPSRALTSAVAPACPSGVATALGHALRRGAGAPTASALVALGKKLAARLCGQGAGAPAGATSGGVVGGASATALAPSPAGPAGPAASGGATGGGTTTPPPPSGGGAPQCSNGIDDDGDGQVDALGQHAAFFDPGCASPTDTTESSEKATPRACGLGIYLRATRRGFGVDFDSLGYDACPKPMVKGIVDLASPVAQCDVPGWEGGSGNASCDQVDGALVIAAGQGGQWQVTGDASADLCGTKGTIVGYAADGQAWEQTMPVFDGEKVCEGPPPGDKACNNGIDDDGDGQVDFAGLLGAGPDPGCSSATDTTEDSEVPFPETGCWPIVAADPDDATVAWLYLLPRGPSNSCPTMTAAWFTFDAIKATGCVAGPYYDGTAAGTCVVKGGDVLVSGGQGTRIAVAVKLDKAIGCDVYKPGHTDMRTTDGAIHDGIFADAYFNGDVLTECP
jgi:hypothetical protein